MLDGIYTSAHGPLAGHATAYAVKRRKAALQMKAFQMMLEVMNALKNVAWLTALNAKTARCREIFFFEQAAEEPSAAREIQLQTLSEPS
eukprot:s4275_g3.t1